ncbi:MAG: AAA family ATPase [Lachnospira sp.]|nr:AAA family ATPase [Lachnospira sp.]
MHIIECYVENFGKLHQYSYGAQKGLNIICEGNGSGKTTLAAFIRAMFYGMPATRTKKALDDAERKKYKPWQGGLWGGYLIFETNGRSYRIERTFADRDSQDTFRLLDETTGLISEDFTKDIGDELFGIDRAGFTSSIYIANNNLRVSFNDSLSARIGDMPIEAEDLNHYEKAVEILNNAYKKYGKNGKPHIWQELEEVRALHIQKKSQYDALAMVTTPPTVEAYPQWKLSADQIERLEKLDDFFSAGVPEQEEIQQNRDLLKQCRTLEDARQNLIKQVEQNSHNKQENVGSIQAGQNGEGSGDRHKTVTFVIGIMLLIWVVITVGCLALGKGSVATLTGVAAAVTAGFYISLKRKQFDGRKYGNHSNSYEDENDNNGKNQAVNKGNIRIEQKMKSQSNEIRRKLQQVESFLDDFGFTKHLSDISTSECIEKYGEQLVQLNQLRMEYAHLSEKEHDYRSALAQLRQKEQQYAQDTYRRERDKLGSEIYQLELREASLVEQYMQAREKMQLISQTKSILEQAHDEMMAGYLHGIRQYFGAYMRMFDSQFAERLTLDVEFRAGIEENGIIREMDFYSQGYRDVIRLCQRLALTESLFTREKPFIILDDPFVNLDDEMLGRAKKAVEMLAQEFQVIYFTCSWTREPEE